MRIPFLVYKVRPEGYAADRGWRGWRLKYLVLHVGDKPLGLPGGGGR
jgi:hypothetical protein